MSFHRLPGLFLFYHSYFYYYYVKLLTLSEGSLKKRVRPETKN